MIHNPMSAQVRRSEAVSQMIIQAETRCDSDCQMILDSAFLSGIKLP